MNEMLLAEEAGRHECRHMKQYVPDWNLVHAIPLSRLEYVAGVQARKCVTFKITANSNKNSYSFQRTCGSTNSVLEFNVPLKNATVSLLREFHSDHVGLCDPLGS